MHFSARGASQSTSVQVTTSPPSQLQCTLCRQKNSCAPSIEKLQGTLCRKLLCALYRRAQQKSPVQRAHRKGAACLQKRYTQHVWLQLTRDQCSVCVSPPSPNPRSFSIILSITAVEFSIQTDVCQVRMVGPQIYISTAPTKTHVRHLQKPKCNQSCREKYWSRAAGNKSGYCV